MRKKTAVAMSGGVDSSVAAALLKEQGHEVSGIFLRLWSENPCSSRAARENAAIAARKLGIPLRVLDVREEFKKTVVDHFVSARARGITPNPCIRCNSFIKFDLLLGRARALGAGFLATGHYAVIKGAGLFRAKDRSKDQSYFLYGLAPRQMRHLLFPVGELEKGKTREIAEKHGLFQARMRDSQDICFVPRKHHAEFLKKHVPEGLRRPGPIIEASSEKMLGRHDGLPLFTLGQRSGLKIGGSGPYYVVGWKSDENALLVSTDSNDPLLMSENLSIIEENWISAKPDPGKIYDIQIRYQSDPIPGKIKNNKITLDEPVRAMAPGQSAVLYDGEEVLGGGVIEKIS